jgi:lysozyme family protein
MNELIKRCIAIVLLNEGGYVNHPDDPGGETNLGITKRTALKHGYTGSMKELTKEIATEIYYNSYWQPLSLHLINDDQLKLQVFDMAVNAGPGRAVKLLQQIAKVKCDGALGPITAKAVNDNVTVNDYKARRRQFYNDLVANNAKFKAFINGWLKRVDHTKLVW